jgi:NAD-dependent deacetylase
MKEGVQMKDKPTEVEPVGYEPVERMHFGRYHNIVILTGAGVSVASGISPFRGPGGLWNDPQIERLAHREILETDPVAAWKFYSLLRKMAQDAKPNAAHYALVRLEASLTPGQKFLLVTQNVDGLHQRAGSRNTVEMHGNIRTTRCSNFNCTLVPFEDDHVYSKPPLCPQCGSVLRPALVFFGEFTDLRADREIKKAIRECDLFISVGTSGTVFPANQLVRSARVAGAMTIYINLEPLIDPGEESFYRTILGKAEEILPRIIGSDK